MPCCRGIVAARMHRPLPGRKLVKLVKKSSAIISLSGLENAAIMLQSHACLIIIIISKRLALIVSGRGRGYLKY